MKKILIVGGGGFLGSNLSRSLRQNGFDITLILKKKEKKHNFVKGKIKRIYCDILDVMNQSESVY